MPELKLSTRSVLPRTIESGNVVPTAQNGVDISQART